MEFTVEHNHLTLNGNPFYPVTIKDLPGELSAYQFEKVTELKKIHEGYNGDLKLSYTLEIPQPEEVDGHQVVTVILSILGLDGEMVRVDNVKVKAIKAADGSVSHPNNDSSIYVPITPLHSSRLSPSTRFHLAPTIPTPNAPT